MPRPRKERIIDCEIKCDYFCPRNVEPGKIEEVVLSLVELECIRLNNICRYNQTKCAQMMGIHQSTFHRMLNSAREKVADALVNGKAISIKGGKYIMRDIQGQDPPYGRGRGRGPIGKCICPKCGHTVEHKMGQPCATMTCSKCGNNMIRE